MVSNTPTGFINFYHYHQLVSRSAVDEILRAARYAKKSVWMMTETAEEAREFAARGASTFIISSDQGLLRKACIQVSMEFRKTVQKTG